jgi:stage II sporulation protein D
MIIGGCKTREFARVTPDMDIEPEFWVRILLLAGAKDCTLSAATSLDVINTGTGVHQAYIESSQLPARVSAADGKITIAGRVFSDGRIDILPDRPHIFSLNGEDYRGKLRLEVNTGGNTFDAINVVPLEPYLAGVVGAEMPDYWELEALKAQAIAARTYCLYIRKHFGGDRRWDVKKTAAHQVYTGLSAEASSVWNAVNQTQGQVLVCLQAELGERLFPTYYSSTCGGHTENSKNVFGDSFEPLAGVPCLYCKNVAKPGFFFWPMVQFDKAETSGKLLSRYPKLGELGEVTGIAASKQSDYEGFSRLTMIKLIGSSGKSNFLRAEDLRLTIDPGGSRLKSTICRIIGIDGKWAFLAGRGFGHGVGMCQCGAEGMAREGKKAEEILSYYYPGSKLVRVY